MENKRMITPSEAIWPWRHVTNQQKKTVWRKALIQAAIASAIAALLYLSGHRIMAYIILSIAAIICFCGVALPAAYEKIDRFGQILGKGAATILTWTLLPLFFFFFFWPCTFFFKGGNKNTFSKEFPTDAESYWTPRESVSSIEQYKRQF